MGLDLARVAASIAAKQSSSNSPFGNTTQGTEALLHEPTLCFWMSRPLGLTPRPAGWCATLSRSCAQKAAQSF